MAMMPPMAAGDAPGGDMTDAMAPGAAPEGTGSKPTVLLTVLANTDGTFQLVTGDENEAIHEEGGEGEAAPADGETYDSAGELLKAILPILDDAQASSSGGTEKDNFEAGFTGGEVGGKKPSPMAGKY